MAVTEENASHCWKASNTRKDLHVAGSSTNRIGSWKRDPSPPPRQGYRPDARLDAILRADQRIGIEVDRQLWRRSPPFTMQQAGIAVLEVTTPDKQDRRRRGKNDDLDAQNAAHAAFAGQRTVTPQKPRRDDQIPAGSPHACRKTAVSAGRAPCR